MRRSSLDRPFTGGMVSDQPAHILSPQLSVYAQDGFTPYGMFRQRQGWEYDGSTADVADNLTSVYRNQFLLADVTRTITGDDDGDLFIHNSASSGTALFAGTVEHLPRCVYRDELMFCAQDGQTPMRRYAGVGTGTFTSAASTYNALKATITATAGSYGSPAVGMFLYARTASSPTTGIVYKVIEVNSTTSLTVDGIKATDTLTATSLTASATGTTYACVNVYDAGTIITTSATTGTGNGTKWQNGGWGSVQSGASLTSDCVLVLQNDSLVGNLTIASVSSDTAMTFDKCTTQPENTYAITRRAPFKDAASHKGSLWGTGVAQYPSRVYVGPPGWNPSFPPGGVLPFDPTTRESYAFTNANDHLMDFVDVPSSFDGDDNIAILSSPNPLLVLKRNAVYGIYGSYPNFSVDMVADGIGCIDIRSAHSYDEGQFWAGEGGIYWYTGGRIVDLTAGKINREWRALTRDFDYGTSDYCTLGVAQGHLVVHITTGGGTTQRTYLCDLRNQSWQSRISNFTPRYMATSRIAGEKEKLLAVSNARQGRVLNFSPALDGSGTAKDDAGDAPRLQAWTPEGIDGSDIDDDTRFIDLAVHANVYDAGAAGSTSMAVSVVSQDALTSQGTGTKTLADIDSDTTDRLDRHYYRTVNRRGRRHQVRLAVDTLGTDANATKVEVAQIDTTFRQARGRS